MSDIARITALNRAAWDASAPRHAQGPEWETLRATITAGGSVLDKTFTKALQDCGIRGARVVQVRCNNGRELLSALSLGAREGWGIDQSPAFMSQAQDLATLSPFEAQYLCADIYALPEGSPRGFDLAFITIGVLNWMPDLPRFYAAVADLLRPGGALVIYETHPMLEMLEPGGDDPHRLVHSYFRTVPHIETQSITYDGSGQAGAPESHWFPHSLSHIVQSALDAGLTLRSLAEYPHSIREVDYDIYEGQPAQLPMCFLLTALKP